MCYRRSTILNYVTEYQLHHILYTDNTNTKICYRKSTILNYTTRIPTMLLYTNAINVKLCYRIPTMLHLVDE